MPQRFHGLRGMVFGGLLAVCAGSVWGNVTIDTVPVGNAGNPGDTRYPQGGVSSFGGVGYVYQMGKYDVTAGQYTAFLNAVAATDTYGVYDTIMWTSGFGCQIHRSGLPGAYSYSVASDWADRPVNYVDWGDSARFANWMHNGQPSGPQGPGTTETGSYTLNGATSNAALMAVTRNADATWVIPTEDEWYKAAYHRNDGVTGNYWDYPTQSDSVPNNGNPEGDTGNSVNYNDGDYTIGQPYYRTNVGFFSLSGSPYGTFDQGGNVWQWNETTISVTYRGMRGGAFNMSAAYLPASYRAVFYNPTFENFNIGLRLAAVPEPATLGLLLLAGAGIIRRKRP